MTFYRYNGKYKIYFKYYLNKKLSADLNDAFPVYILVRSKNRNTKIKSSINQTLKHDSEITQFESALNIEVNELFDTICKRWNDINFNLRELRHKPKKIKAINYILLTNFFNERHGLNLEYEEINEILETVKKARK